MIKTLIICTILFHLSKSLSTDSKSESKIGYLESLTQIENSKYFQT